MEEEYSLGLDIHFSLEWVGDLFDAALDTIAAMFGPAWDWLSTLMSDAADFVWGLITEVCDQIAEWVTNLGVMVWDALLPPECPYTDGSKANLQMCVCGVDEKFELPSLWIHIAPVLVRRAMRHDFAGSCPKGSGCTNWFHIVDLDWIHMPIRWLFRNLDEELGQTLLRPGADQEGAYVLQRTEPVGQRRRRRAGTMVEDPGGSQRASVSPRRVQRRQTVQIDRGERKRHADLVPASFKRERRKPTVCVEAKLPYGRPRAHSQVSHLQLTII